MYTPLLVLQIVVLSECWQGLQQPHGPAAASQECAYSREQPRQGDFRLSILVGKQGYNKAWGDPHKPTQRPLGFDPDIPMEQTFRVLQG